MIFHLSGMYFPSLSSVQLLTPSFSPHLLQTSTPHAFIPAPSPSFLTALPSAGLPWHTTGMEERGVGSEWVHVTSMTNAGRACFAAFGMELPKDWQPQGQAASHLVRRLVRLYKVCVRFQRGRRYMIYQKFVTWPDLYKFTQYKAPSLHEYDLYPKFWRSQNISKAQFSVFLFCL